MLASDLIECLFYRQRLIENLPKLKTIDNETIEDEVVSCDECSSGDESSEEEEILGIVPRNLINLSGRPNGVMCSLFLWFAF